MGLARFTAEGSFEGYVTASHRTPSASRVGRTINELKTAQAQADTLCSCVRDTPRIARAG